LKSFPACRPWCGALYFSAMRRLIRAAILLAVFAVVIAMLRQKDKEPLPSTDGVRITWAKLWEKKVQVPGQGNNVPGIELLSSPEVRVHWGVDRAFSSRDLVDSTWSSFTDSAMGVASHARVGWVRVPLSVGRELKNEELLLNVGSRYPFELYLNGKRLVASDAVDAPYGALPDSAIDPRRAVVPFAVLADGRQESLALRVEVPAEASLASAQLGLSMHAADSTWYLHRVLINHGVFIGINVIILLMSLVIGLAERRDKSWLLLAVLSFVSVLDTLCTLGGTMGVLGLSSSHSNFAQTFRVLTVPWGMYLLIMVLAELQGKLTRKRARRYGIGIAIITVLSLALFASSSWMHGSVTFGTSEISTSGGLTLVIALVAAILAGVSIVGWFAVEEVRLGLSLWRSKGYQRWVGAGAVAASLLTFVLAVVSGLAGLALSSWLSILADYCSFVAVPISVAIYLSIRSAHHTRLVTRQRDELDQEVQQRTAELRTEKERSDELLLNILPHEVAEELKNTGAAAAKHYDQATVLFTDFRGFTQLSEQLPPEELVREIDTCFKHFDSLMDKWGLEKIKTIGDSYMAAGGLPDPAKGGPADVVQAALEMQEFMEHYAERRQSLGMPVFRMRVGIHTGPVVAGIVGVKKFQYDIWGDTVNTASRMESSGEVGKVNISEATYKLVAAGWRWSGNARATDNQQGTTDPLFTFTPRGMVQAKGKGGMMMWFVSRAAPARPAATADAGM
jgi:class 3 adenylate cyclase